MSAKRLFNLPEKKQGATVRLYLYGNVMPIRISLSLREVSRMFAVEKQGNTHPPEDVCKTGRHDFKTKSVLIKNFLFLFEEYFLFFRTFAARKTSLKERI
ncbi:MAG: hypothetical protein K2F69_06455 [Bacteroidaceae bacterium]|nr:hypothetical protein [Bacteroidaceae bacterium]